jgi:serine/threonine protein kinase
MPPVPDVLHHPVTPPAVTETVSAARGGDTRFVTNAPRVRRVAGPPDQAPPETGARVGGYVLCEKLGEGVSCHVFRGVADAGSPPGGSAAVALKILNWENVFDRDAAMRQLRTEAAALARVRHPSVVRFVDFGLDPRWPYLVTGFVEGAPLGGLLRAGGALPARWALHLASQVLDALGAVWRAGLVHRDVKPDNILVGPRGAATLIDFGLAKPERAGERGVPELAGTAGYLAPEQARNAGAVDRRADVYSLGVTLYEALTGRLPFEGRNRMQVIHQHLTCEPVAPAARNPAVPALASDLCLWMLAKDPAARPQTHEELRGAFDTVMTAVR